VEKYPIPFSPKQMVLEVPENTPVDGELVAALTSLAKRGYQIALDDVIDVQQVWGLIDLVHIVKIDLVGIDRALLPSVVGLFKGRKVKLLAEKVETQEDYDLCRRMGFDLFQGYFFCRPRILRGQQIAPTRIVILQLLHKLQNPDVSYQALEQIVSQDVSLGYKLLRLVNSSYYGLSAKVTSIRQAISLIGIDPLRNWLTLFLLSGSNDKPRELTIQAMTRARMCELLAIALHEPASEAFFLTGLFSVLDALLDMRMEQALSKLPLAPEIVAALLEGSGRMGQVLSSVMAYENGRWEAINLSRLSVEEVRQIYLETLRWVDLIAHTLVI
jgi:EAL and modified HD-GYP domain-containing signal transduction protein